MFGGRWETLTDGRPVRIGEVRRLGDSIRLDIDLVC